MLIAMEEQQQKYCSIDKGVVLYPLFWTAVEREM